MKRTTITLNSAAFTLVEMSIALVVLTIAGGLVYSTLMNSTTLMAKNLSLNSSNTLARAALDRIYSELNQANRLPTLVNDDGTTVTDTTESAAGIIFDRYVGGPFIVGNPGTGLAATATTFNLFYSTDPLASPPAPVANDVVIMDGSTRALVSSCSTPTSAFSAPTPTPAPTPGQMVTVTLQNNLGSYVNPPMSTGTAIPWSSNTQQTAHLVHRKAFVVVPVKGINGPPAELRMYPDAENLTAIISDPTKYVVLSREIGTMQRANSQYESSTATNYENKPFAIYTNAGTGTSFVSIAMRVEDQQFNKRLATQQSKEFNTFLRVDAVLRPRNVL